MNEFFNRESETDKRRLLWGSMPEAEVILWSRLKRREDVKTLWLVVPGPPPLAPPSQGGEKSRAPTARCERRHLLFPPL